MLISKNENIGWKFRLWNCLHVRNESLFFFKVKFKNNELLHSNILNLKANTCYVKHIDNNYEKLLYITRISSVFSS